MVDAQELLVGLKSGDRRSIARAISIVESDAQKHAAVRAELLDGIANTKKALRVGISGAPGAGKSSLIETLGTFLIKHGHKVAVLAVDPSSPVSKGSILGDKTRMPSLSKDSRAFIRPSPSRGMLGGVAPNSESVMKVFEAAGFDVVMVETVGVGQSEVAVAELVDTFLLLVPPASGDELQGVKKGIVELAHIVVVTKHDGDLKERAEKTRQEYMHALSVGRKATWRVRVDLVSAFSGEGVDAIWADIRAHREQISGS